MDPEILIVDEALAVGDTRFQMKCISKMKKLKEKGTTILFVSHATEQVKRFCNKAIWLKDGKIEAEGESSEIVDLYEDFMKYGIRDNVADVRLKDKEENISKDNAKKEEVIDKSIFRVPTNEDTLAAIVDVKISKKKLKTFDEFEVEIIYDIYREEIEGFLLGAALYTPKRDYIFGPNTFLEKVKVPNTFGRHKVIYRIPKMPLLGGTYTVDVGIFTDESIVCLDYKQAICEFQITNKYISEGTYYINHEWNVVE